jgi:hypothetical protein
MVKGVILIISCHKYVNVRLNHELLGLKDPEIEGWKVYYVVGDPRIEKEWILNDRLLTIKCEDSYLHLLKKHIMAMEIVRIIHTDIEQGIVKMDDDICLIKPRFIEFLKSPKKDYMGHTWEQPKPFYNIGKKTDTWIPEYYSTRKADIDDPLHGLKGIDTSALNEIPSGFVCAAGPLQYFSNRAIDILVSEMKRVNYNILTYYNCYGHPYILQDHGCGFILANNKIPVTPYPFIATETNKDVAVAYHTNYLK